MTFSCPHYDIDKDKCWRLKTECVPGRPGCVMRTKNSRFAVPAEERVAAAREETRKKAEAEHIEACGHSECPMAQGKEAKPEAKPAVKPKKAKTHSKAEVPLNPPSRAGRGRRG